MPTGSSDDEVLVADGIVRNACRGAKIVTFHDRDYERVGAPTKHEENTFRGAKIVTCHDIDCERVGAPTKHQENHRHFLDSKTGNQSQGFSGLAGGEEGRIAWASFKAQDERVAITEAPTGRGLSTKRGARGKRRGQTDPAAAASASTTIGENPAQQGRSPSAPLSFSGKRLHSQLSSSPFNVGKDTVPARAREGGCDGNTELGCAGTVGEYADASSADSADEGMGTCGDGTLIKGDHFRLCWSCGHAGGLIGCDVCLLASHVSCLPTESSGHVAALLRTGGSKWSCPSCTTAARIDLANGSKGLDRAKGSSAGLGGRQERPPTVVWSALLAATGAAWEEEEEKMEWQENRRFNLRCMVAAQEGESQRCSLCRKIACRGWMECGDHAARLAGGHVTCFPCLLTRQFLSQADVTQGLEKWKGCLVCATLIPTRASARIKARATKSVRQCAVD